VSNRSRVDHRVTIAGHDRLMAEKLDFIINCDIKYRMGKGEADEDEE